MSACVDNPKSNALADDNPNGYITYQCDACKIFPIVDIRYTIGGEVDIGKFLDVELLSTCRYSVTNHLSCQKYLLIDLCQDCFDMGCTYATSHQPVSSFNMSVY